MPSSDSAPNFALLTECDLRDLSEVNLYNRGTTFIKITMANVVYLDVVHFLNGYSSTQSLSDTIEYYATAGGSPTAGGWSVAISDADKITLTSSVASFDVAHTAGTDYLGLGSGTVSSVTSGANEIATLPNDWLRGRVQGPTSFTITPSAGAAFTVIIDGEYQDVRVLIRDPGGSDADAANSTLSLSHTDTTLMGLSGLNSVRWLIDEEGHAVLSYPTSTLPLTWQSDKLRNLLGFTGNESPTALGGSSIYSRLRASFPCSMMLLPTRPVERHQLSTDSMATARRLLGGGMVSNQLATYTSSDVSFYLDAEADSRDLYQHWGDRFIRYTGPGRPLTYVGEWGDSRRHSAPMQEIGGVYRDNKYSDLYSIQPERGRYIGRLIEARFNLNYPGRLRRRVPLSLTIEHDEVS
ncbi:MAG: hypothetical protein CMJ38_00200 [Phycisphaerae bacterium]|nr:hypothetical protein [Phycisphaerae bacterium]